MSINTIKYKGTTRVCREYTQFVLNERWRLFRSVVVSGGKYDFSTNWVPENVENFWNVFLYS